MSGRVAPDRTRYIEPTVLAAVAVALCVEVAWTSRSMLNPDGVSYLDLARLMRVGDLGGAVQGYWSPLYPALIALGSLFTGDAPARLVVLSHAINLVAAITGILLLWHWALRTTDALGARFLLAAFLLASNGPPRIEAVTPDVLVLTLMAWLGYELLIHRDERPVGSGLALSLAYLAKTSLWPLLLLSLPIRLAAAPTPAARRKILFSASITAACVAVWLVPLGVKSGRPTLGSTGRLNYGWYIGLADTRTPDTHAGDHRDYRPITSDPSRTAIVARFEDTGRWTYAPWSDPTAWAAGLLPADAGAPPARPLLPYWADQAARTFGDWLLGLELAVILASWLAGMRRDLPSRLLREHRPALVAMLLGLAGVLQFVAVHSEPRLIAPFALLFALGALHPMLGHPGTAAASRPYRWMLASTAAWLTVIGFAVVGFESNIKTALNARRHLPPVSLASVPERIVVVGPAIPVLASAFLANAHIVAQIPPRSLAATQAMDRERHAELLNGLATDGVSAAWIVGADGAIRVIPLPLH